jgi:enoyl-CoA hydratase/carnithine racemase
MDLNKSSTVNNKSTSNIFEKLSTFTKPLIAKLNGPCLAGFFKNF